MTVVLSLSLIGMLYCIQMCASEYKSYLTPYACALISRGRVFIVKNRGPKTEPYEHQSITQNTINKHSFGTVSQILLKPIKYSCSLLITSHTKPALMNLKKTPSDNDSLSIFTANNTVIRFMEEN